MRFAFTILFYSAAGTLPVEFEDLFTFPEDPEADVMKIGGKRTSQELFSDEPVGRTPRSTAGTPFGSTSGEETDSEVSWEDAIKRFASSPTMSLDVWDQDHTLTDFEEPSGIPSFPIAENPEADVMKFGGKRTRQALFSGEPVGKTSRSAAGIPFGSTSGEETDSKVSWEDAIERFASHPTMSLDSWDQEHTLTDLEDLTHRRTVKEILLDEMIHYGVRVPTEKVVSRVIQEHGTDAPKAEKINAMRRFFLSSLLHPLWFHELLSANRNAPPARIHQHIASPLFRQINEVPPRYLDEEFVKVATGLWDRYCLERLNIENIHPPCTEKRILSVVDGRPIYRWVLSDTMVKAALMDELRAERLRILASRP